ncbi:MAG: hypothetical protein R2849_15950 [Thermomicrobiales bacterium]
MMKPVVIGHRGIDALKPFVSRAERLPWGPTVPSFTGLTTDIGSDLIVRLIGLRIVPGPAEGDGEELDTGATPAAPPNVGVASRPSG